MKSERVSRRGPIAWMVMNSKVANLLMLSLLIGGFYVSQTISKEVFPSFEVGQVEIRVTYEGASPSEIEQSIVLAIEQALSEVEGLDEIESTASEGSAEVSAELLDDADRIEILQDVQQAVSTIQTFPEDAETPVIALSSRQRQVMALTVSGDVSMWQLREHVQSIRAELLSSASVSQIDISSDRELEVQAHIDQLTLERLGLSLADVASTVAEASIESSDGSLETSAGDIVLRTDSRAQWAEDFAKLPILSQSNGTTITLGDIATVVDDFEEGTRSHRYNGENALSLDIYRVGSQTPTGVADAVEQALPGILESLPDNIRITTLENQSEVYEARLHLLLKNAFIGLILVLVLLALFLDLRLAFWVTMGIPTAFLGGLLFLPAMDVSINMISMFAFILALGIVVDDAIIAGENIYEYQQRGYDPVDASIMGMRTVIVPLTFSILSNIVAFIPLLFLPGMLGLLFSVVPLVVVSVFVISWVEALFVLPAHLAESARSTRTRGDSGVSSAIQARFAAGFVSFTRTVYKPLLLLCLRWRYVTFATALAVFLVVSAYVASGRLGFSLIPRVESDRAGLTVVLPVGSSMSAMQSMENRVLASADNLANEVGREQNVVGIESTIEDNELIVIIHLNDETVRNVSTSELVEAWRARLGSVSGVDSMLFQSDIGGPGPGKALTIELSHTDTETLRQAGEALADTLREYSTVSDVSDGFTEGKVQLNFTLLPEGESLGLTSREVSNQVRAAYYGESAVRQQRGEDEITMRVQLPRNERDSEYDLNRLKIVTPGGGFVPLFDVASIERGHAVTDISHENGRRVIRVEANVNPISNTSAVIAELADGTLQQLESEFPGLSVRFRGQEADIQDSGSSLMFSSILAACILYAMLVIPFNSYSQPILILVAIPFGVIGAVLGHLIMGYGLSMISVLGILALSGVVINDSLVMIDYANRQRTGGASVFDSITAAAQRRLRPILITTMTTFGGLAPMIFESSPQARFLIPMAISLGYGILFSTLVCLLLVPALYLILNDCADVCRSVKQRTAAAKGVALHR